VALGERGPELDAFQGAAVVAGGLLGMGGRAAAGHQVQLPGLDDLLGAEAVAVQHLAVGQPGDGLQPDVRVRPDVEPAVLGDVSRDDVVGVTPGAHRAAAFAGERTPDADLPSLFVAAVGDLAKAAARRAGVAAVGDGQ
jgi:hypothetical protein